MLFGNRLIKKNLFNDIIFSAWFCDTKKTEDHGSNTDAAEEDHCSKVCKPFDKELEDEDNNKCEDPVD